MLFAILFQKFETLIMMIMIVMITVMIMILRMIPNLHICFKPSQTGDGRTDGQTDPLIEMRGRT